MIHFLETIAALVRWFRRSLAGREAEIVYLRQQLIILKRTTPARPRLKATDRLIFVCLHRLFPSLIDASIIFKPETLLRWHRTGFRLFWPVEVTSAVRPTCRRSRHPTPGPAHQSRQSALGGAKHPRRAAQAGLRRRPVDCR
jgi:hypothetical protein